MTPLWGILFLSLFIVTMSTRSRSKENDFMSLNQCPWSDVKRRSVKDAFVESRIVPDVINEAPKDQLAVIYPLAVVNLGNHLPPNVITHPPYISYDNIRSNKIYTLMFITPDYFSPVFPQLRSFILRLQVNYPGDFSYPPDTVAPFLVPNPYKNAGETRFIHLAFEQSEKIDVSDPEIVRLGIYRNGFNVTDFAIKYKLGNPVAGNFFVSEATAYTLSRCECI